MKALIKKCLLAGFLLMLTACAHYYPRQTGYYPNTARYSSGYSVSQRNYYNYSPGRNYNYNNWRGENSSDHWRHSQPVVPQRHHDGQRPQYQHNDGDDHFGNHHNQSRDHDRHDGNSWQSRSNRRFDYSHRPHQGSDREHDNRSDHQERRNNKPGQNGHGHSDRDDD